MKLFKRPQRKNVPRPHLALQAPLAPETGSFTVNGMPIPYVLQRSRKRRRTLALSVESDLSLRIMVPARARLPVIEEFVTQRADWIQRRLAIFKNVETQAPLRHFVAGEQALYQGRHYPLKVTRDETVSMGCVLGDEALTVNIHGMWLAEDSLRDEVRFEIASWYKKQARLVFQERMDHWSRMLGLPYKRLIISSPRSQWGSCDVRNVIRLNWRLIMASVDLLDYVIVHELCHVAQKNHSPRFWKLVAEAMPDYAARRAHLRKDAPFFRFAE